jgi:hypothetical protein
MQLARAFSTALDTELPETELTNLVPTVLYCCNMGHEWYVTIWRQIELMTPCACLKLPWDLFGLHITSFSKHLNAHYKTYPENAKGRFLNIGGTGSTACNEEQVATVILLVPWSTGWILDSDPGAKRR